MNLSKKLQKSIKEALFALYQYDCGLDKLKLSPTERGYKGTHTLMLFAMAGMMKIGPLELGSAIGDWLVKNSDLVLGYEVVKGFLNLTLRDKAWDYLLEEVAEGLSYKSSKSGRRILVEFSQPNTNKPLHLGHLRNNFLGTALSNILMEVGHDVSRVNIMNDRGIHICKSMIAYERYGKGQTPESTGMKGDHFVGHYYVLFEKVYKEEVARLREKVGDERARKQAPIMCAAQEMLAKWESGDKAVCALWKKMNAWVFKGFDLTYKRSGTFFDKIDYESDTYLLGKEVVKEGLRGGIFQKREDGSVWIDLRDVKLGEKLLLRGNGTTVYMTQDMGLIDSRYETYHFDKHIYVVGNEQKRHFEVLFEVMRRLGRTYEDKLYHLAYGMVDLPSGKMKSREGTSVDADNLIDQMVAMAKVMTESLGKGVVFGEEQARRLYDMLGIGAIKYFLLRVNPHKRLLFNPKETIDFQGNTAAFIQYTHARVCTMLRKARCEKELVIKRWDRAWDEAEQRILLQLGRYYDHLRSAAQGYNPAILADYVYQLAKAYNHMYAKLPMMHAKDRVLAERRLYLSWVTARLIKKGMLLLGIEVPDRM